MGHREVEYPRPDGLMRKRIHARDDILELDHDLGDIRQRCLVDLAVADDALIRLNLHQDHVVALPRAA